MSDDTCIVRDEPDAEVCGEATHSLVTVTYEFGYPEEGTYEFEIPMCEGHTVAMKHRVDQDLMQTLKRKG